MILGQVTAQLEPLISLHIEGDNGQTHFLDAAIDTGFSAYLSLPPKVVATLGLPWIHDRTVLLGNGTTTQLDIHAATVIWNGQPRKIEVHAVDSEPLIGMKMLAGYEVRICVVDGGRVWIDYVP